MKPPRSLRFRHIRGLACASSNRKPGRRVNGPGQTRRFSPDASKRKRCRAGQPSPGCVMAVSKRLRFEVLRRDNHACRYCGQMAPDVKLTVDHVIPVSLGGPDEPSNLVAACVDCNSGKASNTIDAATVADVSMHAAAWDLARAEALDEVRAENSHRTDAHEDFYALWTSYEDGAGRVIPIDPMWRATVTVWLRAGLTVEQDLEWMVARAMSKKDLKQGHASRYQYLCGIVWNVLKDIDARAKAKTPIAHHVAPHPSSRYVEPEVDSDLSADRREWLHEMHLDDAEARYGEPSEVRDVLARMFGPT